jgi:hypothetical protein
MIATDIRPTTVNPAGHLWPIASPGRRFALTDTALTSATQRQVRAALLGGRAVVGYLEPQARRIPLRFALGSASQVGIAVTTRRGRRIFVSLAQAITLLVGRVVETQLPQLRHTLPILDRLPTDRAASGEQVVYALGVNQVLPMAARLRWRWSDGHEERPVAAMTTEEAYTQGFRLRARAAFPGRRRPLTLPGSWRTRVSALACGGAPSSPGTASCRWRRWRRHSPGASVRFPRR